MQFILLGNQLQKRRLLRPKVPFVAWQSVSIIALVKKSSTLFKRLLIKIGFFIRRFLLLFSSAFKYLSNQMSSIREHPKSENKFYVGEQIDE